MATECPFQLIIVRDENDRELAIFDDAIVRAFVGGAALGGYLATGEDLGIELKAFRSAANAAKAAALLDEACHSLVVVLVGPVLADNASLLDFVAESWAAANASSGRHSVLSIAQDERAGRDLLQKRPVLKSNQVLTAEQLGERAMRPAIAALRALHEARKLLGEGIGTPAGSKQPPGVLQLFISHAKLDGLPLAQSLKHLIAELTWLRSFYDVRDLADETDWETALREAATNSTLIILRTEAYDGRPWCRQETLWAEESAAPTVLVDARPGLAYPAGELPLERMPSVRIPDGNLMRILNAALRESLRYLLFQRRVKAMAAAGHLSDYDQVIAFSYPPSMSALMKVCSELAKPKAIIVYPDPPLRRGLHEAATALVQSVSPQALLATPETLAATR